MFLNLEDRACLVVGGGAVGERKVRDLLAAGARVTVVSPECTPGLAELAARGQMTWRRTHFSPPDLAGMDLVIGATSDPAVNREVSAAARERHLPVNIADAPELGTFIVPATVRRGALTIAVSTGGASPALARQVRRELEAQFGPEYEGYIELLAALREKILARRRHHPDNQALFTRLVQSPLPAALRRGDRGGAVRLLQESVGGLLTVADLEDVLAKAWPHLPEGEKP